MICMFIGMYIGYTNGRRKNISEHMAGCLQIDLADDQLFSLELWISMEKIYQSKYAILEVTHK